MRADARITHDRIIAVATEMFGRHGTDTSLNQIAQRAGVGPGTLYRHFPTREALIDACMSNWGASIQATAQQLRCSRSTPDALLLRWFQALIERITIYRGSPARLLRHLDSIDELWIERWRLLTAANTTILTALSERGQLQDRVDAREVMILICGVAAAAEEAQLDRRREQALLRIVVGALVPINQKKDCSSAGQPSTYPSRELT